MLLKDMTLTTYIKVISGVSSNLHNYDFFNASTISNANHFDSNAFVDYFCINYQGSKPKLRDRLSFDKIRQMLIHRNDARMTDHTV